MKTRKQSTKAEVQLSIKPTARPTVAALEKQLQRTWKVLDHGFVRVVDYMGDDSAIVQAARVSYGKGTKTKSKDKNLIFYLMKNGHTSPFEMCEIKLHIKLPIFVARQWIRHRTANVNEYSARYSILDAEFYLPPPESLGIQSTNNKQGRADAVTTDYATKVRDTFRGDAIHSFHSYNWLLNDDGDGHPSDLDRPSLSREIARIGLPLSTYTQMYWKIDLHNLFNFLRLRVDSHAQREIREYASSILKIVSHWVPISYSAFLEYQLHAKIFSAAQLAVISEIALGNKPTFEKSGLSKSEWNELSFLLNPKSAQDGI
jgi:thymidylate synthase (FAD)